MAMRVSISVGEKEYHFSFLSRLKNSGKVGKRERIGIKIVEIIGLFLGQEKDKSGT